MTAFVPADLPSTIDTVEKLAAWSASILTTLYPDITTIESDSEEARSAQASPFYVTATNSNGWIFIVRLSLDLTDNWQGSSQIFNQIEALGTGTIPNEFKS